MKRLIEVIAKGLVDHPDAVRVEESQRGDTTVYSLSVDSRDMGKIIGKHGRVAKTIRTVAGAAALRENRRVSVEIV